MPRALHDSGCEIMSWNAGDFLKQALLHEDAAAGLPDYKGIPVYMGRPYCQDKIEIANEDV